MTDLIQRNLNAGELSPLLQSRADIQKYTTGLSRCENFITQSEGGVSFRPGFRYLATLDQFDSASGPDDDIQLFTVGDGKFVTFSESGMYVSNNVSSFTNGLLSLGTLFFSTNDRVRFGTDIKYTTSGDFMYYINWDITDINNIRLVNKKLNITDRQVDELERRQEPEYGVDIFNANVADGGDNPGAYNKTIRYRFSVVDTAGRESEPSDSLQLVNIPTLNETRFVRFEINLNAAQYPIADEINDSIDYIRIYKSFNAADDNDFGWIGDIRQPKFTDNPGTLFDYLVLFFDYNYEPVTSDNYSRVTIKEQVNKQSIAFYQQRLVTGGDFDIQASRIGEFEDFTSYTPIRDDDAFSISIAGRALTRISHLVDTREGLHALTNTGIYVITEGQNELFTPSTTGVRLINSYGCSNVEPVVINGNIVFVSDDGKHLYEYLPGNESVVPRDLTILASHLFTDRIKQITYTGDDLKIVWVLLDNGKLLAMKYLPDQNIYAWQSITYHAVIKAISRVVSATSGASDQLVIISQYGNENHVEQFDPRGIEATYLDSSVSAARGTTGVSMAHLGEGVTVRVIGKTDDNRMIDFGDVVIGPSGTVPLTDYFNMDDSISEIEVGVQYTGVIETMELDPVSAATTLRTNKVSVDEVIIDTYQSSGGRVSAWTDAGDWSEPEEIKPRFQDDNYGGILPRDFKFKVTMNAGWVEGAKVRIEQHTPRSMTITSITPRVTLGGR